MAERSVRVLCLGNDLVADDGVGPAVAGVLRGRGIGVEECPWAGLALLDAVTGVDRLVVVDAVVTGSAPPGTIRVFDEAGLEAAPAGWQHTMGLLEVVRLARALGLDAPADIVVVAVEAGDLVNVGGPMTAPVAAAVPEAAAVVEGLLAASAAA